MPLVVSWKLERDLILVSLTILLSFPIFKQFIGSRMWVNASPIAQGHTAACHPRGTEGQTYTHGEGNPQPLFSVLHARC